MAVRSDEPRKSGIIVRGLYIETVCIREIVIAPMCQGDLNASEVTLEMERNCQPKIPTIPRNIRENSSHFTREYPTVAPTAITSTVCGDVRPQPSEFTKALESIVANLSKIGFHDVKPLELAVLVGFGGLRWGHQDHGRRACLLPRCKLRSLSFAISDPSKGFMY
jgi:hypothetical protein